MSGPYLAKDFIRKFNCLLWNRSPISNLKPTYRRCWQNQGRVFGNCLLRPPLIRIVLTNVMI